LFLIYFIIFLYIKTYVFSLSYLLFLNIKTVVLYIQYTQNLTEFGLFIYYFFIC